MTAHAHVPTRKQLDTFRQCWNSIHIKWTHGVRSCSCAEEATKGPWKFCVGPSWNFFRFFSTEGEGCTNIFIYRESQRCSLRTLWDPGRSQGMRRSVRATCIKTLCLQMGFGPPHNSAELQPYWQGLPQMVLVTGTHQYRADSVGKLLQLLAALASSFLCWGRGKCASVSCPHIQNGIILPFSHSLSVLSL